MSTGGPTCSGWARSSARSSPAQPAYTGAASIEILRKAMRGDTADALARLDGCGAEAELIALARDCLAVEPEDRPRDAGLVAERITAYLAGVQERVSGGRARACRGRGEGDRGTAAAQGAARPGGVGAGAHDPGRPEHDVLPPAAGGAGRGRPASHRSGDHAPRPGPGEARGDPALGSGPGCRRTSRPRRRSEDPGASSWPCRRRSRPGWTRPSATRPARSPGRHPLVPRPTTRTARTPTPPMPTPSVRRDRSGEPVAGRGGGEDQGPPAVGGAGPGRGAGRLGGHPPRQAGRRGRSGATDRGRPRRRPRPLAQRAPHRPGSTRQGGPADRSASPGQDSEFDELGPISLHLLGTGLDDAGDRPWPSRCCARPSSGIRATSGSTMTWARVLEKLSAATRPSASTPPPMRSAPRRPTSWPMPWRSRGESDEAIAVFRDLTRLRPGERQAPGLPGQVLKAKGLSREADEALEAAVAAGREAIRLKPDHVATPTTTSASPWRTRASSTRRSPNSATAIRLKPDTPSSPTTTSASPWQARASWTRPSPNTATAIRLKPDYAMRPHQPRQRPARPGEARRGDRRIPHGDPAQARPRRGPLQPRHRPAIARASSTRRSPNTARRSGSSPTTPRPTYNLGVALRSRASSTRPSPNTATAIRLKPDDAEAH